LLKVSNLLNRRILIFGLNGSGKTHLAKKLSDFFRAFVITLNPDEWKEKDVIVGECKTIDDIKFWLDSLISKNIVKKLNLNCVILDDFDVYFDSHFEALPSFQNLIFRNRHIHKGVTVIAITRRPQNIPAKYYETFDILVAFANSSPNVFKKLNEIKEGLGDLVKTLTVESHKFVWFEIGKEPIVMKV
jgi:hypothetical protein